MVKNAPQMPTPMVSHAPIHCADGTACQIFGPDAAPSPPSPPLILIHGLGLNQAMWRDQTPALSQDRQIITYDLYGHGDSPAPPEPPSLALFARQFAGVMAHFDLSHAIIAGFSLGGMIVRRIAMDMPHLVSGLAILNSPHARTKAEQDAIQARVHQAAAAGPGATIDAALERWFTPGFHAANPAVMQDVRDWVLANDPQIYPTIYQVLVDGVAELVAPSPPIAAPCLVLTGGEDYGNNPAMSAAIAAEIAGASLVILPGLRHMAMCEAPDIFNHHLAQFCATIPR